MALDTGKLTKIADSLDGLSKRMDAFEDRRGESKADADWVYGTAVKIKGGMKEFVGKTGYIMQKEGKHYRVKLDTPVEIEGVGKVTSDLWEPSLLKKI